MTKASASDVAGFEDSLGQGRNDAVDFLDPQIGRLVAGKYRILSRLGQGGMGAVYVAEQLPMGRRVALKILKKALASDPVMMARFEREARTASRVHCPEVVTIHDFGVAEDGLLYIVMELIAGRTLGDHVRRDGGVQPHRAVEIGAAIARGLAEAHRSGVVHRDLKPDNVVLSADGRVVVVDFGIARIIEEVSEESETAEALTVAGAIVGTPAYMSPEACARRPVGPRGDLYSLGTILFELLVGRPPFEEDEDVLLMGMHLRVPPELLREARPELPVSDALEALVDALLEKDPNDRPSSAEAVADALAAIVTSGELSGFTALPEPRPNDREPETRLTVRLAPRPRGWSLVAIAVAGGATLLGLASILLFIAADADSRTKASIEGEQQPVELSDEEVVRNAPPGETGADARPRSEGQTFTSDTIEIRVPSVSPPGARVTWDGERVQPPFVVARDGAAHELRIRARGYEPLVQMLTADTTQTVATVRLVRTVRNRMRRQPAMAVQMTAMDRLGVQGLDEYDMGR
jgi:serine/threonine-protein kinase